MSLADGDGRGAHAVIPVVGNGSLIRRDGDDEGARGREAAEPLAERRKLRAADDRAKGVTDQSRRG